MKLNKTISKSALITGGPKRIGRSIALFLAKSGYNIAISYNNSEKEAKSVQSEIAQKYNVKCEIYQFDLTKKANCFDLIQNVLNDSPNLSVLINNASTFEKSNFTDDLSQYEKNIALHLTAPIILSQEFTKHVNQNNIQNANIINMVDRLVTRNKTAHFYYLLSKKSLDNLTKMLATSLAPQIRTNAIAPGYILDDDFIKQNPNLSEKIIDNIPLKRKGDLKNITQAVDFIVKNDYINGQTLFVDGGSNLTNN